MDRPEGLEEAMMPWSTRTKNDITVHRNLLQNVLAPRKPVSKLLWAKNMRNIKPRPLEFWERDRITLRMSVYFFRRVCWLFRIISESMLNNCVASNIANIMWPIGGFSPNNGIRSLFWRMPQNQNHNNKVQLKWQQTLHVSKHKVIPRSLFHLVIELV